MKIITNINLLNLIILKFVEYIMYVNIQHFQVFFKSILCLYLNQKAANEPPKLTHTRKYLLYTMCSVLRYVTKE